MADFGDFGEYSDGFSPDFGGWGDFGEYSGGFAPENSPSAPDLAAGYDLMSNPNSMQVPSDPAQDYNESGFSQFAKSNPVGAFGLKGLSGLFGPVGKLGMAAVSQDKGMIPAGALSMLGGGMFGPIGALAGGFLGSAAGKGLPGYSGGPAGSDGANGMSGGDIAETLGQLYGAYRAGDGAGGAAGMNTALQDQVKRLSEIYGPNSAYATQMRQTLARKDAAAGRNSQYGPREAQLQALLADKQTQATDAMSRAAATGNTNALAMAKYKQQLLGQRLGLASNVAKKTGLFNLFGNAGNSIPFGSMPSQDYGLASSLVSGGGSFNGGDLSGGATFVNSGGGSGSDNPLLSWFD